MPIIINGKKYYKTNEACKKAGISRATFFRWLKTTAFQDVAHKDRRGWRLFTNEDIERLKTEANRLSVSPHQQTFNFNKKKR
ncbi:MAG: MerR family transcriptional regulator [Thermodesulfovibrionia bacterium]|nr:MerR family transcriptional regulator [Thermodesulfovibrionia bacterium]MCK5511293.1 MerR family transcriptional regulator [Thermodesulfovibrionia bacterium]